MGKIAIFLLLFIFIALFSFGYIFFSNIESLEHSNIRALEVQQQVQGIEESRIKNAQALEAEYSQQYALQDSTSGDAALIDSNMNTNVNNGRPFGLFIVLDDAGTSLDEVRVVEEFQGDLSIAIIPHLQHSKDIADFLYKRNISYIIHLPMEPLGDENPGHYSVSTETSDEELKRVITYHLTDFEHYLGFNNHMGSKAVADPRVVDTLLGMLERRMIVLDSRTSADSILEEKSKEYDMIGLSRDVFIDNYDDMDYIKEQIREGVHIAKQKHAAILIGHITKEHTMQAIIEMYDEVTQQNGKFLGLQDYRGFMSSFR